MIKFFKDPIEKISCKVFHDNAVKKFDARLSTLSIQDLDCVENVEDFKLKLFQEMLTYYDKRVKVKLETTVPSDWMKDKGIISKFKRALLKDLESKILLIEAKYKFLLAKRQRSLKSVMRGAEEMIEQFFLSVQFPMNPGVLKDRIFSLEAELRKFVSAPSDIDNAYPTGIRGLDRDSHLIDLCSPECTDLFKQVRMQAEVLTEKNERAIEKGRREVVTVVKNDVAARLASIVELMVDEKLNELSPQLYYLESYEKKRVREEILTCTSEILLVRPSLSTLPPSSQIPYSTEGSPEVTETVLRLGMTSSP
eukprot:scaffold918_cov168-Ochromonas_danica.AAC.9